MIEWHPSLPFLAAALLIPFLPEKGRQGISLLAPLASFFFLSHLRASGLTSLSGSFLGQTLTVVRLDSLSLFFVYAFLIFAFLAHIYALHVKEKNISIAANLYIGSSLGAVLAGDLITLFIFWEIMALASAVLIWNKARSGSSAAIFRYLLVHLTGGLFFFAGILIRIFDKEALTFSLLEWNLSGMLIFIAFCVNAAVVPLHAWLADAYPEGTPEGSVYLCAFTTKVAVYAFARGFAGHEILIWLGALSAVYGVIFALMENDMRKLLSYHIVCQIGYMLCGIGIGTELAVNAGTGHAVGNIFFKGLLFMATGALIHRTGKYKLNELGGLFRKNRLLFFFFMVGALAISGFPFLNGYVTKVLLLKAAGKAHLEWLELTLLLVTVGTFMSIALKLAFFAFWGADSSKKEELGLRPCPLNMTIAMGGLSLLCAAIGFFPNAFYHFFPVKAAYSVYTPDHILHTLQLLAGTLAAFGLMLSRLHVKPLLSLDTDWFYRKGARLFLGGICQPIFATQVFVQNRITDRLGFLEKRFARISSRQSISAVAWPLLLILGASLAVGIIFIWKKFS